MADNRRAGERTIFRGNVDVDDTLAEISQALDKERRTPIAAVDAGFIPPAGRAASNIPAMADLEEELLREFAIYDGPAEGRETARRVEPTFAAAAPAATPAQALPAEPLDDDDDDTMPPVDAAALFSAPRRDALASRPVPKPERQEPEPPAVFEPEADSAFDFAPELPISAPVAPEVRKAAEALEPVFDPKVEHEAFAEPERQAEPEQDFAIDPVFDGPVPDLFAAGEDELSAEPLTDVDNGENEPVFAGPVPDFDFDAEPAFAGPAPDLDLDLDLDLDAEQTFAGPVPDFDFSAPDPEAEAESSVDEQLAGELQMSIGKLDLAPETLSEPVSPFAAWKNDRLSAPIAGEAVVQPVWHKAAAAGVVPDADEPDAAESDVETVEAEEPAALAPETAVAEVAEPVEVAPLTPETSDEVSDEEPDFDFELDADDLLGPVEVEEINLDAATGESLDAHAFTEPQPSDQEDEIDVASWEAPADAAVRNDEPSFAIAPTVASIAPAAGAAVTVADAAVLDLPDWLQPSRRPTEPLTVEPAPVSSASAPLPTESVDDQDLFKDFEFNFDDDAIEAEVSRAVMSELQGAAATPAVVEEAPFDPSQITEIEERMPSAFAKLDVPQVPETESEVFPKPVSDFDYDIEAEMAELFALGNKAKTLDGTQTQALDVPDEKAGDSDAFDQGFANEIIRSIHETPAIPAGRAFDVAQMNAASTGFVSRYARLAAVAALVAFGGVGAIMLWRSGDVPGLATDGAPRVIMADKAPIKEVPENPGGKQVPNQDKAVYDRVAGKSAENVKQDSLIATSEEPVNVAEKTLANDPSAVDEAQVPGVSENNADARLPATPSQSTEGGPQSNDAVAPRKVKTMIVLPNGTLVARETPAPADAKPAATSGNPAEATTLAAPANEATPLESGTAPDVATLQQPADAAANAANATTPAEKQIAAPVPVPRPVEQPVNVVGTVTQRGNVVAPQDNVASAAVKPAAAPAQAAASAAPAATSVPAGTYVIQIASLPSQEEAQKSYSNLSGKFASVIGGRGVDIKPAEIAGKGIFYRVRIVAGTKDEAIALCTRYKAAGGSCLVSR